MRNNIPIILIFIFISFISAQDDGHAPTFMIIDPAEDFYSGNEIELEVQIEDNSNLNQVLLF